MEAENLLIRREPERLLLENIVNMPTSQGKLFKRGGQLRAHIFLKDRLSSLLIQIK
jgi:hypothetical protein